MSCLLKWPLSQQTLRLVLPNTQTLLTRGAVGYDKDSVYFTCWYNEPLSAGVVWIVATEFYLCCGVTLKKLGCPRAYSDWFVED